VQHFDWNEQTQNLVLSSFFWGYVVTQIPGGMIAQRWGAQRLLGLAVGFCALLTLLIPMAATYGEYPFVCACRVFCGFCQGVVPPVLHTLLAKWVPLQERGRFSEYYALLCSFSRFFLFPLFLFFFFFYSYLPLAHGFRSSKAF
jgi:ACS family sodium-dependent inorganic phosphate cotransporter